MTSFACIGSGFCLSRCRFRSLVSLGAPPLFCRAGTMDEKRGGGPDSSPFPMSALGSSPVAVPVPLPVRRSDPLCPAVRGVALSSSWARPVFRLPKLALLPAELRVCVLAAGSLLCLDRSFCCFLFKPCNRLMIISLMRGRNFSKLAELAS